MSDLTNCDSCRHDRLDLDETLAPIRERLAAATPGPWAAHDGVEYSEEGPYQASPPYVSASGENVVEGCWSDADAALIAHAPTDLATLLALVDTLAGERDRLAARVAELEPFVAFHKGKVEGLRARIAELQSDFGAMQDERDGLEEERDAANARAVEAERERDAANDLSVELAATLANERGEGEPPSDGWEWTICAWGRGVDDCDALVSHVGHSDDNLPPWEWLARVDGRWQRGLAPTARAAMRLADCALVTP